jgi:hypothetical protein
MYVMGSFSKANARLYGPPNEPAALLRDARSTSLTFAKFVNTSVGTSESLRTLYQLQNICVS